MGALFLINRLTMKRIDEDGYPSAHRSALFKLCGSMDEAHQPHLFYDKQGRPRTVVNEPPEPLIR